VTDWPSVLFVCVQNAGRSQMAAALLAREAGDRLTIRSAGSMPAQQVHPNVIEAMSEHGIDLSQELPKALTDDAVRSADVVITMGCGDACPIYPGKTYRDWDVDDPAGKPLEDVRRIRDDIQRRVTELVADVAPHGPVTTPRPPADSTGA
jgi:protein-tyrosine-phosphatase